MLPECNVAKNNQARIKRAFGAFWPVAEEVEQLRAVWLYRVLSLRVLLEMMRACWP